MAHKRAGHLTVSKEWAKHLRRYGKHRYWKAHRRAERTLTRTQD